MEYDFNFCRKCGYQNPAKNNFCARCGEALKTVASVLGTAAPAAAAPQAPAAQQKPTKCPNCNGPLPPDADFCKRCGIPISNDLVIEDQSDLALVKVNLEQLDFENHRVLKPVFKGLMKKKIIIDLTNVKWMDSTGIGTLVTLTYQGSRTGQEMKIIGMNKRIFEAVKSLQVDNVLELCGDVNECRVAWGLPPV